MKFYYLIALGLSIPCVSLAQHLAEPDQAPKPAQAVKVGLRVFNQPDLVVGYERQLTPRFSLLGGLGYFRQRYSTSGLWFTNAAGQSQPEELRGLSHSYHADLQLRYYFRPRVPRPALTGWYATFALQGTYRRTQERYVASPTVPVGSSRRYHTTSLQPQVYLGRQWGLGQRIILDTFVGTCVYRRESVNQPNAKAAYLDAGGGLALGWRL